MTKAYTIKFSKAGINQYADFKEVDGVIVNPYLNVSWVKTNEIPDITKCKTIEEILEVIKSFSYCNQAEIYLIDYSLASYYNNTKCKELVKSIEEEYDSFIIEKLNTFFLTILVPILKKNKWFIGNSAWGRLVLIKKDKNGEWDNVNKVEKSDKKEFEFEYLCAKILKSLDIVDSIDIKSESNNYLYVSHLLFNRIDEFPEYFIKL